MKKLTAFTAAILLSASAMAQTMGDEPCPVDGATPSGQPGAAMSTKRCEPSMAKSAQHADHQRMRISYVLEGKGWTRAGSVVADDGVPSRVGESIEQPYIASVEQRDGKAVTDQRIIVSAYSLVFAPKLTADGAVRMVVEFTESATSKAITAEMGTAQDTVNLAPGVNVSHALPMHLDQEIQIPLPGMADNGTAQYTLKVTTTAI